MKLDKHVSDKLMFHTKNALLQINVNCTQIVMTRDALRPQADLHHFPSWQLQLSDPTHIKTRWFVLLDCSWMDGVNVV